MDVEDLGHPISVPVGTQALGRVFSLLGDPIDGKGDVPEPDKRYPHRASRIRLRRPFSWKRELKLSTCSPHIPKAEKSDCSAAPVSAKPFSSWS
jgi:hypothetical protein